VRKGTKIYLTGVVQGVGFRPFLHRLAKKYRIVGYVRNTSRGVVIFAEGDADSIEQFLNAIRTEAPPLAQIKSIEVKWVAPFGYDKFTIEESFEQKEKEVIPPPDVSVCELCIKEMLDPKDRRYRYPFINCTNCGPRLTIIKKLPYDRPNTTMDEFEMCPECEEEYKNIEDRRYHAQPIACPRCGPKIIFYEDGQYKEDEEALRALIEYLRKGEIVAVKGIGGFHLLCDAKNEEGVTRLRKFKERGNKPMAVISLGLRRVEEFAYVNETEKELLLSPARPIVLLRKKVPFPLADSIAPYNNYIGVMLPYSPLHFLILYELDKFGVKALVDTSGNLKSQPLIYENGEAIKNLSKITKYILLHNRKIYIRCDDSVAKVIANKPVILRRARGYVPLPIKLKKRGKPILGCGGELKNTFCIVKDDLAFLSQHIGDMENYDVARF